MIKKHASNSDVPHFRGMTDLQIEQRIRKHWGEKGWWDPSTQPEEEDGSTRGARAAEVAAPRTRSRSPVSSVKRESLQEMMEQSDKLIDAAIELHRQVRQVLQIQTDKEERQSRAELR